MNQKNLYVYCASDDSYCTTLSYVTVRYVGKMGNVHRRLNVQPEGKAITYLTDRRKAPSKWKHRGKNSSQGDSRGSSKPHAPPQMAPTSFSLQYLRYVPSTSHTR